MDYITHYYRFESQAQYQGLVVNVGQGAVDVIGIILGADGYHVNARWPKNQQPEAWATFQITAPDTPVRKFA
jgi:hypothetical protein